MRFSKLSSHFSYANVTATLALVLAMSSGAYAASKYLISSTKQISPKVLKSLKGQTGPAGPQGAAGPAGPAGVKGDMGAPGEKGSQGEKGPQGEKGLQGEAGQAGKDGFNGSNGVNVTSTEFAGSQGSCKEGGSEFTAAASKKTFACNGKEGKEGSPWTDGGSLPVGASEAGQWSMSTTLISEKAQFVTTGISFPVRLAKALDEAHTHVINAEEGENEPHANLPTGCSGNYKAPKAASGNLCIFTQTIIDINSFTPLKDTVSLTDVETGEARAGISGGYLTANFGEAGVNKGGDLIVGTGDWVVTA